LALVPAAQQMMLVVQVRPGADVLFAGAVMVPAVG
jgi:hypothetical protein